MNKKFFITLASLIITVAVASAQNNYSISGLGRTIITRDKLSGPVLNGDNSTPNKGVGGYVLFDLGNNLEISKDFRANATLRLRTPYGAFWGVGTELQIRQFQITGKIRRNIEFQLGDINIGGMTPYTVFNFNTEYHRFESDIFRIRRNILEYENFNFGNDWRLQGAHAKGVFNVDRKYLKAVSIYSFVTRTNATNEIDVPDRILAGTRVNLIRNDFFEIGANYTGLQDITLQNGAVNYQNNVLTGSSTLRVVSQHSVLHLKAEAGFSDFDYSKDSANVKVSYNDYIYDIGTQLDYHPLKIKVFASFRDVGPNFTSPAAQTQRIDVTRTPQLFPTIYNNSVNRNQTLFDRFTDEKVYKRSISPVLLPYVPRYNNITPYGRATPNRRGVTGGIAMDTSMKVMEAEVIVDMLNEVIGEGISDKRQFLGVRGGTVFKIDRLMNSKKLFHVSAGARYEKTTRSGLAPINFSSTLLDVGVAIEVFKQFDILFGSKLLYGKGNEFVGTRNEFNQISEINEIHSDITENIYSAGVRLRFRENSFFNVSYNISQFNDNLTSDFKYNINQLFVDFTLKF